MRKSWLDCDEVVADCPQRIRQQNYENEHSGNRANQVKPSPSVEQSLCVGFFKRRSSVKQDPIRGIMKIKVNGSMRPVMPPPRDHIHWPVNSESVKLQAQAVIAMMIWNSAARR